jgi:hypothetical protein
MIHLTKTVVRKWVTLLLHTHDSPRRTAAAFALGVFIGFSPFFGLHTLIAIVASFALRLNRLAAIAGAYVNLPWFIGPYYTLTTVLASKWLGVPMPENFADRFTGLLELSFLSQAFWAGLGQLLRPLLTPFMVGSTIGAAGLAAIAYALAVPAIVAGRRHLHLPHRDHHRPEAT